MLSRSPWVQIADRLRQHPKRPMRSPNRRDMSDDCLFCKIANHDIPANIVYEDEELVAFHDVSPQAPCHLLIVPHRHISTLNDTEENDRALLGTMLWRATQLAKEQGHAQDGYRTVFNCNRGAGQSVFHIHLHLLAGRNMTWPPG